MIETVIVTRSQRNCKENLFWGQRGRAPETLPANGNQSGEEKAASLSLWVS